MSTDVSVRWGWLKAMYIYNIVGAGGFGLALLFFPGTIQSILRFPPQDPVTLGLYGSVLLAVGLISIAALRFPLKFVSILFIQLVYKPIWLAVVAIPLFIKGQFPLYVVFISAVFFTYIIGNLIAIPFSYLLSKK
jgi:hypothetical protein